MHAVQLPFPIGIEPLFHDDVMPHYPAAVSYTHLTLPTNSLV